jgi:hypothetical protein
MIEVCRFHNKARRLQPMPLKATGTMIALGTKFPIVGDSGDGLFFKWRVIVKHLPARVPWIDPRAPCSGNKPKP